MHKSCASRTAKSEPIQLAAGFLCLVIHRLISGYGNCRTENVHSLKGNAQRKHVTLRKNDPKRRVLSENRLKLGFGRWVLKNQEWLRISHTFKVRLMI